MSTPILPLFRRLSSKPGGKWLFSRLVCLKAPYFASIAPRMELLEPGRAVATLRHRRAVTNHLGTVHAIALCNLAEFVGGLTCEASIPAAMRWIPKGMTVQYLKKAQGALRATATPDIAVVASEQGYELPVSVDVQDAAGEHVFHARIAMWVSPRQSR